MRSDRGVQQVLTGCEKPGLRFNLKTFTEHYGYDYFIGDRKGMLFERILKPEN